MYKRQLQGDRRITEITSGLSDGELVVTSGQFLLDAEAQLQEALGKLVQGSHSGPDPETAFSCPMHPEVVQSEPGRCPECGMDLEPIHAHPEASEETEAPAGPWSCPDHPTIAAEEPGPCIICGRDRVETPDDGDHR